MGSLVRTTWREILVAFLFLAAGSSSGTAVADPPADQDYTGSKRCASCHFEQFMAWKKTKHAEAFKNMPDKYKTDPACLKCHTTGYGQPSGFKDLASTPNLAGNTCETCHGPGSEHEKISQKYAKKKLTAAEEKEVRDSIWLILPTNICIECHVTKAHKAHEKYEE